MESTKWSLPRSVREMEESGSPRITDRALDLNSGNGGLPWQLLRVSGCT